LDNNKLFLDNVFFPYLEKHGIRDIIHLGDLVDRRKFINFNTLNRLKEDFLHPLTGRNMNVHIIAGNHDTYFKNTNEINALRELVYGKYPFHIYDRYAEVVKFENLPILLTPWICDDNRKQVLETIQRGGTSVCAGHLEIQGFEMYRGSIVSHGDDRSLFGRFDMVLSGHFHHRSTDGSIFYLGSHGEFTWSDYDDPRGFHILDTETLELTFIENPYKMFNKIWYNDTNPYVIEELDLSKYAGQYIKVVVSNKNDPYTFDRFIDCLEKSNPLDVQIVEDHLNLDIEDESIINEAESTLDIFNKYIESIDSQNFDKQKVATKINEIYYEALKIE
jgi:predicted phosphodiesterase